MSKIVSDGNLGVHFVTSVANISAPTVAEKDAGTNLTTFTPKDGVEPGVTNNRVDIGDLSTAFDPQIMGTWGSELTITFFLDDSTNTAWDTLGQRGVNGFMLLSPFGIEPVANDPVWMWQIQTGTPIPQAPAANETQRFQVEFACQAADLQAVVAA